MSASSAALVALSLGRRPCGLAGDLNEDLSGMVSVHCLLAVLVLTAITCGYVTIHIIYDSILHSTLCIFDVYLMYIG